MDKFVANGEMISGLVRVKLHYTGPDENEVTIERRPGSIAMRVLNKKKAKKALDDVITKNRRKK